MNFTAIDFETAHASFPCEIGLSRVENGIILKTQSWLIKPACFPYMNHWNQRVHGISSADVADALSFEELWSQLMPWLEDTVLVAHNAAFDMRVLRASLEYYDLAIPHADYFCSVSLSRKTWKNLPGYSLGVLSDLYNIQFNHHRAGDDACACAQIVLKAIETLGVSSVDELLGCTGLKLKKL